MHPRRLVSGVIAIVVCHAGAPGGAAAAQFTAATKRALTSIAVSGMGAGAMPGMVVGVWVPKRGTFRRD